MDDLEQQAIESSHSQILKMAGVISLLLVFIATSLVLYSHYRQYIIEVTEHNVSGIAKALSAQHQHFWIDENVPNSMNIAVAKQDIEQLDQAMRQALHSFDIVKIKLFDRSGKILYSSDLDIIGKNDPVNEDFRAALAGKSSSDMESKNQVTDLANETRIDVDVVETYVPARNANGDVIGVFEIYQDATKYRDLLLNRLSSSMIMLGSIFILTFLLAFHMINNRLKLRQENLELRATTDALTGLFNRREILNLGHKEFARFGRGSNPGNNIPNEPFALLMVDVDQHQSILNQHGHLSGDQILQQVAGHLKNSLREYNTIGRYGGESFMILLPDTDSDDAVLVGERLLEAIRNENFITEGMLSHDLTLSIGISISRTGDKTFDDVMRRADSALYLAKEGGTDQAVVRV